MLPVLPQLSVYAAVTVFSVLSVYALVTVFSVLSVYAAVTEFSVLSVYAVVTVFSVLPVFATVIHVISGNMVLRVARVVRVCRGNGDVCIVKVISIALIIYIVNIASFCMRGLHRFITNYYHPHGSYCQYCQCCQCCQC